MTPQVTRIQPIEGEVVEFDDGESYIRYAPDRWVWAVGESTETVFHGDAELEAAYQRFKTRSR